MTEAAGKTGVTVWVDDDTACHYPSATRWAVASLALHVYAEDEPVATFRNWQSVEAHGGHGGALGRIRDVLADAGIGGAVGGDRGVKGVIRLEMAEAFGLDPHSEKVCAGVEKLYARGYRPKGL